MTRIKREDSSKSGSKRKQDLTAAHEWKNTQLIAIFDELTRARPDLLEEIPQGAVVIMQIREDEGFNSWAREIAEAEDPQRPRLYIEFMFRKSVRTTLKKPLSWEQVEELKLLPA